MQNHKGGYMDRLEIEKIFGINFKDRFLHVILKNADDAVTYMAYIKTYLYNLSSIPNIVKIVDSIIESRAITSFDGGWQGSKNTLSEIEKMIDMTERKKRLIIIRNTMKTMLGLLDDTDKKLVFYKYVKQEQIHVISNKLDISVRNLYRRYHRIVYNMALGLLKNGYSIKDFEKEIEGEDWLKYYFRQILENQLVAEKRKSSLRCVRN